jgi:glycosyltransferase involved in cell wall biosynthesis
MTELRVLLVGNYTADAQWSMERFATLLHGELRALGVSVDIRRPPVIIGGESNGGRGLMKWLGYADKFLLFPPRLRKAVRPRAGVPSVVHVCDHSNALYVPWIRDVPHVVTCHDLLAVRAALGEFRETSTRWTGRRLQQIVRRGLQQASRIVCDSDATRTDLRRIVPRTDRPAVIHPGVSAAFAPVPVADATARAERLLGLTLNPNRRFILHVGGNQWYKNRAGLIDIYAALVERMPDAPPLVLAGQAIPASLVRTISARSLAHRVVSISDLSDADLAALYSSAELLLFPSLAEGFGWPVVEAMACGCRVIASGRAPITEVAVDVATYIDPVDADGAAQVVERVLREPDTVRRAHVTAGLSRAARFTSRAMAEAYVGVYRDVLEGRRRVA